MYEILINYDSVRSIKDAERKKEAFENKGMCLMDTIQTGFNTFKCVFY